MAFGEYVGGGIWALSDCHGPRTMKKTLQEDVRGQPGCGAGRCFGLGVVEGVGRQNEAVLSLKSTSKLLLCSCSPIWMQFCVSSSARFCFFLTSPSLTTSPLHLCILVVFRYKVKMLEEQLAGIRWVQAALYNASVPRNAVCICFFFVRSSTTRRHLGLCTST